jgi:hypothetical protein
MMIAISKVDIAVKQLETAIDLYVDRQDYICAITLAGAAEEILGKLVQRKDGQPAVEELCTSLILKYVPGADRNHIRDEYLNKARNSLKHANQTGEDVIKIEVEAEVMSMISRALSNLLTLDRTVPYNAEKFFRVLTDFLNT